MTRIFSGWVPVAAKEIQATLLRPRLLIVTTVLTLAILGGTYGILAGPGGVGGIPGRLAYGFPYWPDLNSSRPALAVFVASPTGDPLPGVATYLVNISDAGNGPPETLETKLTNASGWARFEGLSNRYPNRNLAVVLADDPGLALAYVSTYDGLGNSVENRGQLVIRSVAFGGAHGGATLSLVFLDAAGTPIEGGVVYIWRSQPGSNQEPAEGWAPYSNGTTDTNGYYLRPEPLDAGFYRIRVAKATLEGKGDLFFAGGGIVPPGPDGTLAFSAAVFFPILLPVLALTLAYDAIARERAEGSLDMLLSKPVSRIGVALGKLSGAFFSMAIPVVVIALATATLILVRSGQSPTGTFFAALLGAELFLLLASTLLFLTISSFVRSLGNALLVSVLFFLLFVFLWDLIGFLVASLFAAPGSVRWFEINTAMSLLTPVGIYLQLLNLALPVGLLGGLFGFGGAAYQLPSAWISAAAFGWVVSLLALFVWAMQSWVTEG